MTETRRCVLLTLVRLYKTEMSVAESKWRQRRSGTAVCEKCSAMGPRRTRKWGDSVENSHHCFRLTAGEPGGLMRTPDSLMSNILIIVAGLAWPWLVSCDWKPGLDFKNGSCGLTGCLRVFCRVIPDCLVDVGGCTVLFFIEDESLSLCLDVLCCCYCETKWIMSQPKACIMVSHDW